MSWTNLLTRLVLLRRNIKKALSGWFWLSGLAAMVSVVVASWGWAFDENSPYGVVAFIPSPTRWQAIQDAQIVWNRCGFSWMDIEATQGVYNWTTHDQLVAEANARGVYVYAGLGYCPTWASAGTDHRGPIADTQAWYDFVYACVSRYKDSVKYWELWNEPNLDGFWAGTRSQYINDVLKIGADAIHAADPTAKVCGPELAHLVSGEWYYWLRDVIEQGGDKLDVVTHHCYKSSPSQVTSELEKTTTYGGNPSMWGIFKPSVREVLVYTGWLGKPFWLTETGWRSDQIGETQQASYLTDLWDDWFPQSSSRYWVHKILWYQIWENDSEDEYGLLNQDESRKPSWYAYRDLVLNRPAPITVLVDLNTPDGEDGVTHLQVGDGDTTGAAIGGRSCRRNVDPNNDYYFYFSIDDDLVYQGSTPKAYVIVDYFDTGSGSLTLEYDAAGSAYKNGGSVTLRGTNTWKQYRFLVTDAYFGNGQNNAADFRIARSGNNTFYLDVVQVAVVLPPGSPTARFTADPTFGPPPLHVNFDASASVDPDGTITTYAWDFGDDASGYGQTISHDYTNGGIYEVTLRVTDNSGYFNIASTTITVLGSQGVSIDLGSPDVPNGMTHPQVGDGDTTPTDIGGRNCRRNVTAGADNYFYFGVSDAFAFQGSRPDLYITFDYYDTGSGSLMLQYDSPGDLTSNKYKDGGSVYLTGSNTWKRHAYHVTDAYFGNRQNGGADFRIAKIGGELFYIDKVYVNTPPATTPIIELNISSLTRTVQQGGNLPNDGFTVTNVGAGTLEYDISDNASWLQVSPDNGTSTGEADPIDIIYTTASLGIGSYSATISVEDDDASNSPQTIIVNLQVTAHPEIGLSISSLNRTVLKGRNLPNDIFTVTNVGGGTLNYAINDNASWLQASPDSGTSTGESDPINIIYGTSSLAVGNYSATISVEDDNATNSPQTIEVDLEVKATAEAVDFDGDGDVDQEDFGYLQACFTGLGVSYGPDCADADTDSDNDVDQNDFTTFLECMGGADKPPDC